VVLPLLAAGALGRRGRRSSGGSEGGADITTKNGLVRYAITTLLIATLPAIAAERAEPDAEWGAAAFAEAAAAASKQWQAGLASVKITPEGPVAMAGYAARDKPSEGVVADLYAKVLALEDGNGQRAVWITTDLIGLRASVAEPMLRRIVERTGLKRHELLVNSSHTHTGPAIAESDGSAYSISAEASARTRAYARMLQDRIVTAVDQALARMEPAELSFGGGVVPFVMNRREFTRDRGVILGVNPRGPADRTMPLLKVSSPGGAPRAVVFGAATHNTTLTGNEYRITGDYAGFAQEYVQKQLPGVQAMFVLGCAGDANPYPRGTLELARQHGETLGREVLRVLDTKLAPVSGPLKLQFDYVDLPFAGVPPRPELEKMAQPPSESWRRWTASRMLETLDGGGKLPAYYRAPLALWQFGTDLTLVALSGEVVVDYVHAIENALGPLQLWISAYNHDVFGYFPSARVLAEGGYETRGVVHGGLGFFSPKAQDVVVAKVRELAQKAGRIMPAAVPEALRSALTFHASFDGKTDAAHAAGDPKLYWAPTSKQRQDAKPGLPESGEVQLAPGAGRFGDALRFTMKKSPIVFYRAANNVPYSAADWSGTVSFWLSVDPEGELEPGFCDPVQITPRAWNDAAFFVEFEKRPESIPFRLGVYADLNVWNPQKRRFADIPMEERPLVTVNDPPFSRGKWTHVLFTFERFNTGRPDGMARLYLDGEPHGELSPRQQTFTWDPQQTAIALGLGYIGMIDELSIFNRVLDEGEIRTLHTLEKGVSSLLR
jgi:hypothetical protein